MKLLLLLLLLRPGQVLQNPSEHLLQAQLEKVLLHKNFAVFEKICTEKVAVNCDAPMQLTGYFYNWSLADRFFQVTPFVRFDKIEWSGFFVDEDRAVESINAIAIDTRTNQSCSYKLIIFLIHNPDNEWKVYYLRGLKI
jgi:hypothetical protein